MAEFIDKSLTLVSKNGSSFCIDRSVFLQKSAYYKALVTSGMKDSISKELKFDLLSEASLVEVSNYFSLNSDHDRCANDDKGKSLDIYAGLEAASYLQIDDMMEKYSMLLINNLNPSTWLHALDLCQRYGLSEVLKKVLNYVCINFQLCCNEEDFLSLNEDQVEFILQSDETSAVEVVIFDSALKWLLHEPSRFELIPKLLENIRFELMGESELEERKTLLNSINLDSGNVVASGFSCHLRLRCATKTVVAMGGFTKKEFSTNRFQILSTSELEQPLETQGKEILGKNMSSSSAIRFRSNQKCRLPRTLCEHGACVVNGRLYIAGGQVLYHDSGRFTTNKVFVFNPVSQVWSACSNMNVPRSLFYFGELNGFVYAVSGCTASNADTHTVERYLPGRDSWEMMAPLDVRVHELAGCSHGGNIYVSGGFRGPALGHVDLVWRFEPNTGRWTRRAPMLKARSYHAMVAVPQKLFVMGGVCYLADDRFEDVLDGEMYDPMVDQWSQIASLSHPASCMSSVVVKDRIFLFGGHSFVRDKDHNFVQVINVGGVSKKLENCIGEALSENLKVKKMRRKCESFSILDCQVTTFQAHGISYFSLCEMNLPKIFVEQFH